jgi:hypothetical protein
MSHSVSYLPNIGKTLIKQTSHLFYGRYPECHPMSLCVLPRPLGATDELPERMIA